MRPPRCLLPAIMLIGILSLGHVLAAEPKVGLPALEDAVRLSDQTLLAEKSVELALPPLPAKPGKIIVLRFRMVSYAKTAAGCNMNATVETERHAVGPPHVRRGRTADRPLAVL